MKCEPNEVENHKNNDSKNACERVGCGCVCMFEIEAKESGEE